MIFLFILWSFFIHNEKKINIFLISAVMDVFSANAQQVNYLCLIKVGKHNWKASFNYNLFNLNNEIKYEASKF